MMLSKNGIHKYTTIALIAALISVVIVTYLSQPHNTNSKNNTTISSDTTPHHRFNKETNPATNEFNLWQDPLPQWIMAIFTILATCISWLAVVYVRDNLMETRKAVKAAEDTAEVTREIGRAEIRAYLTCTEMEYAIGNSLIRITIKLTNTGASPARKVIVGGAPGHSATGSGGVNIRHRLWFNGQPAPDIAGMSSAETIVLLNRTAENSEHFDKLWEGRIHLQFACVVNWSDVFGDPQVAEFKFGVTSDEDEKFFGPIPPYKKLMKGFQADAQTPAERGKKGHG